MSQYYLSLLQNTVDTVMCTNDVTERTVIIGSNCSFLDWDVSASQKVIIYHLKDLQHLYECHSQLASQKDAKITLLDCAAENNFYFAFRASNIYRESDKDNLITIKKRHTLRRKIKDIKMTLNGKTMLALLLDELTPKEESKLDFNTFHLDKNESIMYGKNKEVGDQYIEQVCIETKQHFFSLVKKE